LASAPAWPAAMSEAASATVPPRKQRWVQIRNMLSISLLLSVSHRPAAAHHFSK